MSTLLDEATTHLAAGEEQRRARELADADRALELLVAAAAALDLGEVELAGANRAVSYVEYKYVSNGAGDRGRIRERMHGTEVTVGGVRCLVSSTMGHTGRAVFVRPLFACASCGQDRSGATNLGYQQGGMTLEPARYGPGAQQPQDPAAVRKRFVKMLGSALRDFDRRGKRCVTCDATAGTCPTCDRALT